MDYHCITTKEMQYEGMGWLSYDHQFRQLAAVVKWFSLDNDFWYMCFTDKKAIVLLADVDQYIFHLVHLGSE